MQLLRLYRFAIVFLSVALVAVSLSYIRERQHLLRQIRIQEQTLQSCNPSEALDISQPAKSNCFNWSTLQPCGTPSAVAGFPRADEKRYLTTPPLVNKTFP